MTQWKLLNSNLVLLNTSFMPLNINICLGFSIKAGFSYIIKYKKLRNLVTSKIRQESIAYNSNRIKYANVEGDVWKVVKDVTNPQQSNNWSIKMDNGEVITDEKEIANVFNDFFVTKITNACPD